MFEIVIKIVNINLKFIKAIILFFFGYKINLLALKIREIMDQELINFNGNILDWYKDA